MFGEIVTEAEFNSLVAKKIFDVLKRGKIIKNQPGGAIEYGETGWKPILWDVVNKPNDFGCTIRILLENTETYDRLVFLMPGIGSNSLQCPAT